MEDNNSVSNLNIDELLNEYNRISNEIADIDNLYNSSKDLLDSNRGTRMNYVFISNQTSNLISIKNHKLNLLKTMNDIKKSIIDLKIKEFNLNSKNNSINDNTQQIINEIYNKMLNGNTQELLETTINNSINDENLSEEDIDKLLENRLKEINGNDNKENSNNEEINENDNTTDEDSEKEYYKYRIVIQDDGYVPLIVDDDYNLIEDENDEDYKELKEIADNIVIVDTCEEDDTTYAIDSEGNYYEMVSV